MRKQTALSSFLVSEKTPDAGQHSRTRAEKDDQMILKGSNDAVGRIDTRAWEAAFKHALAATQAPCTVVFDAIFVRRMLPLSLPQHGAALPPYPPRPLSLLFRCGSSPLPCLPTRSVDALPLGALFNA